MSATHDLTAAEQTVWIGAVEQQFQTQLVLGDNFFYHRNLQGSWDTLFPVIGRQQMRHEADGVNRMTGSGSSENPTEQSLQLQVDLPLKGDQQIPYSEQSAYGFDVNGVYSEALARGAVADRQYCVMAQAAEYATTQGNINTAYNLINESADLTEEVVMLLSNMSAQFTQLKTPNDNMRFACLWPHGYAALARSPLVSSRDFNVRNQGTDVIKPYLYYQGWIISTIDLLFGSDNSAATRFASKYRHDGTNTKAIFWWKNAVVIGDVMAPEYNVIDVEHYDTYLAKARQHFGTGVIPGHGDAVWIAQGTAA